MLSAKHKNTAEPLCTRIFRLIKISTNSEGIDKNKYYITQYIMYSVIYISDYALII